MQDRNEAIALGATLYLPGPGPHLPEIALGRRYPQLRSAVICLEDSIRADEAPSAMRNVARLLDGLPRDERRVRGCSSGRATPSCFGRC